MKIAKFCNILTFYKAFGSIPDLENLGYQVEMINLLINFELSHKPLTIIFIYN